MKKPTSSKKPALAALALGAALVAPAAARAEFMVAAMYASAGVANDGGCSLREAIQAVNLNKQAGQFHGDCENQGNGWHEIMLEGVVTARYKTFGETISRDVHIYPYGVDDYTTIEHTGAFTLRVAAGVQAYLYNMTIQHAGTGQGRVLENAGTLHLYSMTVANGAVQNNSGTASYGGGIYNTGSVYLWTSTVRNNKAKKGGGIYTSSDIGTEMHESTISDNTASEEGGGIYNGGRLRLENSTISTNTATGNGGGVYFTGVATNRYLEFFWSTVAFNKGALGGGVYVTSTSLNTVTDHSIIGRNRRSNGTTPDDYRGNPHREGGMNKGSSFFKSLIQASDQPAGDPNMANDIRNQDPLLGSLTFNHGGPTKTHTLNAGSPARNAGGPDGFFVAGYDQNFNSRPGSVAQGDLGAVEVP